MGGFIRGSLKTATWEAGSHNSESVFRRGEEDVRLCGMLDVEKDSACVADRRERIHRREMPTIQEQICSLL